MASPAVKLRNFSDSDWAIWLDKITQKNHSLICEINDKVYFLNAEDRKRWLEVGASVTILTAEKIIQISEEIFLLDLVKLEDQDKIVRGLEHLRAQRKNKYEKIGLFFRFCAWLKGRTNQLVIQNQQIEKLKSKQQNLQKSVTLLSQQKILPDEIHEIKTLFHYSVNAAQNMIASWLTKADGTSYALVKGIECSQLRGIKIVEPSNQEKQAGIVGATTQTIEQCRVIFLQSEPGRQQETFVLREYLDEGSYKVVWSALDYRRATKLTERNEYVFLELKKEIDSQTQKMIERGRRGLRITLSSKDTVMPEDADLGSIEGDTKRVKNGDMSSSFVIEEEEKKESSKLAVIKSSSPNTIRVDSLTKNKPNNPKKEPSVAKIFKSISFSRVPQKTQANDTIASYQKEIRNCLQCANLAGVMPTYKVMLLNGKTYGMLQLAAGYITETVYEGKQLEVLSLFDMHKLSQFQPLTKKDQIVFLNMMRQALLGIKNLHERELIHRDLKPENILCMSDGSAKVSDLGALCASHIVVNGKKEPNEEKKNIIGTAQYMAPEVMKYGDTKEYGRIDLPWDIWSVGIILFELYSGKKITDHPAFDFLKNCKYMSAQMMARRMGNLCDEKTELAKNYEKYTEPVGNTLERLVWQNTRANPLLRPDIHSVIAHFEEYATYVEKQLESGEVQFIHECYDHDYLA